MNVWNKNVDEIITQTLKELGISIIDKVNVDKKLEYVLLKNETMISLSYTIEKSYDFMVVNKDSNKIIYSTTEFNVEPEMLRELIIKDLAVKIRSLLPENKFDYKNLDKIKSLSDADFRIIIKDLMEWTKDINWPIAMPIIEILTERQSIIVPYLKVILKSQDWEWEGWILKYLVSNISDEYLCQLKEELKEIIDMDIDDDDFYDLKKTAQILLERI